MSNPPSADAILEIATELGVAPSFIEKDWYAVQVLKLISELAAEAITPIFSGGTSLSKGYGLIQRFSEDIDFQVVANAPLSRAERRAYREKIIGLIREHAGLSIDDDGVKAGNNSSFFSFNISYPQTHQLDGALRSGLQLEMSFKEGTLPMEQRPIQSFVAQFMGGGAETHIACITPVKTAADKLSALLWRIIARDRRQKLGSPENDPTIIRHLHDLSALEEMALADTSFVAMVHTTFDADRGRGGTDPDLLLADSIRRAQSILTSEEKEYRTEYTRYVDAMSYARDDEKINFEQATGSLARIIALL